MGTGGHFAFIPSPAYENITPPAPLLIHPSNAPASALPPTPHLDYAMDQSSYAQAPHTSLVNRTLFLLHKPSDLLTVFDHQETPQPAVGGGMTAWTHPDDNFTTAPYPSRTDGSEII